MKKFLVILLISGNFSSFSQSLSDSLIAFYPFKGNAIDSSGNGNNGSVIGAALTTDRFGIANSAYYFDGNQDEIRISGAFNGQQPFSTNATVCYWMNTKTVKTAAAILSFHSACTNNDNDLMTFYINNAAGSHYLYNTIYWHSPVLTVDESDVTDSSWHFVCYTYNHDTAILYLDGIIMQTSLVTPASGFYFDNSTDLVIGNISSNACGYDFYFEGSLDEIRIYNRTLTHSEVNHLNNNELKYNSKLTFSQPVLYPNPALNAVIISNLSNQIATIEISDITGKILLSDTNSNTGSVTFYLDAYANGLYQVQFKNIQNQIVFSEKLMISK